MYAFCPCRAILDALPDDTVEGAPCTALIVMSVDSCMAAMAWDTGSLIGGCLWAGQYVEGGL